VIKNLLAHPLTKGLSVDDPGTTALRGRIIREKPFLRRLYTEWYERMIRLVPEAGTRPGDILELGSWGGFLKELLPECITSEVFPAPGVDRVLSAEELPFGDGALRAILMIDVLHHIPDVRIFFKEAQRTLVPGGRIIMLEPWNTFWGRFVYTHLHHEPFLLQRTDWDLPELEGKNGPLSRANGALPWMIFSRDRATFERAFPYLAVERICCDYPFSYLASGGVSMRSLTPGWSFGIWRAFERLVSPLVHHLAMFALITVGKRNGEGRNT
jgi:SAM-dependent methyltransferase